MGIGYAIGAQPHMTASIGLLQSARAELGAATPNKGGHREKAMQLIDQRSAKSAPASHSSAADGNIPLRISGEIS